MENLYTMEFAQEFAEIIKNENLFELSERYDKKELTAEDEKAIEVLDNFAKDIGKRGVAGTQGNTTFSELIKKIVEPLVFNPDESILSRMFMMGSIGEFDETRYTGLPKNTIKVHNAVRGGNVPKSYVDPQVFTETKVALQCETELDYSDLRKNGWKSIVKMAELARESFEQEMFYRLFEGVDAALDPLTGSQDIATGTELTQTNMDTLQEYIADWNDGNAFIVGLSKYINQTKRMEGVEKFLSDEMKNELNRLGILSMYDGIPMSSVPYNKKTASGKFLMPDKRIYGIAGQIGEAKMRGEMRMYETYNHDEEKVALKFTGYDFEYVIYYLDKIARITFS